MVGHVAAGTGIIHVPQEVPETCKTLSLGQFTVRKSLSISTVLGAPRDCCSFHFLHSPSLLLFYIFVYLQTLPSNFRQCLSSSVSLQPVLLVLQLAAPLQIHKSAPFCAYRVVLDLFFQSL